MAKHHTMVPPILHVVYAQSTGAGLTKWTSSSNPSRQDTFIRGSTYCPEAVLEHHDKHRFYIT